MPEYKQGEIAAEIERRIVSGEYKRKLPSAELLAAEFNVNIRTLAKALSLLGSKGLIEKRRGIGAFIKGGGTGSGQSILIDFFTNLKRIEDSPYHHAIYKGIKEVFDDAGCKFELRLNNFGEMGYEPYSGVLFIGFRSTDDYKALDKTGKPYVIIEDMPDPKVCTVSAGIRPTLYKAISRMIGSGYKRIAYVGMTTSRQLYADIGKFHAWLEAVDDAFHGLDFSLVRHVWPEPGNGYAATLDLLDNKNPPDAIFVTSDIMAPGVYRAIAERGLKVPDDIGVLGCDGIQLDLSPSLSSIFIPREELGRQSAQALLSRIREPGRRHLPKIVVPCEFVPGGSLRLNGRPPSRRPNSLRG